MADWPAAIAAELLACHEAAYERVAQECDALIASMGRQGDSFMTSP